MSRFLTMKHWQLFLIFLGIPVLMQVAVMLTVFTFDNVELLVYLLPVLVVPALAIFFGWWYTLGTRLHAKIPSSVRMSITRFKIFLFVPLVYMFFIVVLVALASSSLPEDATVMWAVAVILPLHFFSMFCIFYCLYFIAKALKIAESQADARFSEFVPEFLLFWLFPIGIWNLQPRINKLFGAQQQDRNLEILDSSL